MVADRRTAASVHDPAGCGARRAAFRAEGEGRADVRRRGVHRRRQARGHCVDRTDICRKAPRRYRAAVMTIDKAIILCGRTGLASAPADPPIIPKCLIDLAGQVRLIAWQIESLVANGITDIVGRHRLPARQRLDAALAAARPSRASRIRTLLQSLLSRSPTISAPAGSRARRWIRISSSSTATRIISPEIVGNADRGREDAGHRHDRHQG
jgi:hypothetical protein